MSAIVVFGGQVSGKLMSDVGGWGANVRLRARRVWRNTAFAERCSPAVARKSSETEERTWWR